jgi:hypothetical protein
MRWSTLEMRMVGPIPPFAAQTLKPDLVKSLPGELGGSASWSMLAVRPWSDRFRPFAALTLEPDLVKSLPGELGGSARWSRLEVRMFGPIPRSAAFLEPGLVESISM